MVSLESAKRVIDITFVLEVFGLFIECPYSLPRGFSIFALWSRIIDWIINYWIQSSRNLSLTWIKLPCYIDLFVTLIVILLPINCYSGIQIPRALHQSLVMIGTTILVAGHLRIKD